MKAYIRNILSFALLYAAGCTGAQAQISAIDVTAVGDLNLNLTVNNPQNQLADIQNQLVRIQGDLQIIIGDLAAIPTNTNEQYITTLLEGYVVDLVNMEVSNNSNAPDTIGGTQIETDMHGIENTITQLSYLPLINTSLPLSAANAGTPPDPVVYIMAIAAKILKPAIDIYRPNEQPCGAAADARLANMCVAEALWYTNDVVAMGSQQLTNSNQRASDCKTLNLDPVTLQPLTTPFPGVPQGLPPPTINKIGAEVVAFENPNDYIYGGAGLFANSIQTAVNDLNKVLPRIDSVNAQINEEQADATALNAMANALQQAAAPRAALWAAARSHGSKGP